MDSVGNLRRASGDYAGAESLLREAFTIAERTREEADPARLRVTHDLASVLHTRRKRAQALPLYQRVLEIRARTLATDSPDIAIAESNVSLVLKDMGDSDGALQHIERAVAIYRKILPPGHNSLASALLMQASIQYDRSEYEQAQAILDEAMDACRATFGDEHPAIARILYTQSNAKAAVSQSRDGEDLCVRALEMRRKTLPADHPDIAISLRQLASYRNRQGRRDEALALTREALEIFRVQGASDFLACETTLSLGTYEYQEGNLTEAERLIREAREMLVRLLGEDHPAVSGAHSRLAAILEAQQRYDEALEWRQRVLDFKRRHNEPANEIAGATEAVGLVLMKLERWQEAEDALREAVQLQRSFFGPENFAPARPGSALGECLTKRAQYPEAEIELLEAERVWNAHQPGGPNVQETRRRLVDLYRAWDKPEQAETWRAKLSAARPLRSEPNQR